MEKIWPDLEALWKKTWETNNKCMKKGVLFLCF